MLRSVAAGRIVELERVQTIADGLGARKPGLHTLSHISRWVDGLLRVSDDDLLRACRLLLHEERIVAEPAGAAGLAALLRHGGAEHGRVMVIVSGANIADSVLSRILL